MATDTNARARIQALNDLLRVHHRRGLVMITAGVKELGSVAVRRILHRIAIFDDFTPENDPRGVRDHGALSFEGRRIAWKIDYYDPTLTGGSYDPSDEDKTTRVMTVLLPEEW